MIRQSSIDKREGRQVYAGRPHFLDGHRLSSLDAASPHGSPARSPASGQCPSPADDTGGRRTGQDPLRQISKIGYELGLADMANPISPERLTEPYFRPAKSRLLERDICLRLMI